MGSKRELGSHGSVVALTSMLDEVQKKRKMKSQRLTDNEKKEGL